MLMKCGHSPNATHNDKPACAICLCYEIKETPPDLTGRIAKCGYNCGSQKPSSFDLAFFGHQPTKPFDSYYCGCFGWD